MEKALTTPPSEPFAFLGAELILNWFKSYK